MDLDAASRKFAERIVAVLLKGEPLSKHNVVEIGARALKTLGADPTTSHINTKKDEY